VELRQYFHLLKKYFWFIILGTLLAAGSSYGVSSQLPPIYRASTSLFIGAGGAIGEDYGTVTASEHLATSYKELLTKRSILESTAKGLQLAPQETKSLLTGKNIEARLIPNTSVIILTVENSNPIIAMRLTNGIVAAFKETLRELGRAGGRDLIVVEPAIRPLKPVAPRKFLNTLAAAIGGAFLAISIVLLLEYLDDTLKSESDISQNLSLPTLATIPYSNPRYKRSKGSIALTNPVSPKKGFVSRVWQGKKGGTPSPPRAPSTAPFVEGYHVLSTRIQLLHRNNQLNGDRVLKSILLTGPLSGKDQDQTALNLGIVMAQADLKVLLVDADLRRPHLHRNFGLTNDIGLTTLITGNGHYQDCVVKTDFPNLDLLCSGPPQLNPAVLSSTRQMAQLIERLKGHADLILFDAPSILLASEVMALASQVEGVILTIHSHATEREVAIKTLAMLSQVDAKILGAVLRGGQNKRV